MKLRRLELVARNSSLIVGLLMLLAKVVGTVVATRKDSRLEGKKLLIVAPLTPEEVEGQPAARAAGKSSYLVAVDTVSAGFRETVIIVQGSSARMAVTCKDCPVDTAIVGIVDTVSLK
ncbi:MAG TPA: EutN/CcmL family microcompartment protein [Terriglobia bacterium]